MGLKFRWKIVLVTAAPIVLMAPVVLGMPDGTPGMEGPNLQPYDVLAFDRQGHVYARR